ncbi:MAG: DUF3501 family protein [Bdellovibrionales bacterium]|nr:DUF3501 family protein [Bdellovibrionales bacterium]
MKIVKRDDIVDYETYRESRDRTRKQVLSIKDQRRVHLGENLTFLFENHATIQYQVQEMMLAEKIVKEKDIQHEIKTYNQLLGEPGDLGCTLFIEFHDPAERDAHLRKWLDLPRHLYLVLENGNKAYGKFDPTQIGEDRLSSVQYITFPVDSVPPIKIGCDFELYNIESELSEVQKKALASDLKDL